ncbi:hypothetical protein TNCV_1605321 [Trichonephila clavipes]|nr:hypothetical protein TNCV_1605321 [Trichonephila clavipes]
MRNSSLDPELGQSGFGSSKLDFAKGKYVLGGSQALGPQEPCSPQCESVRYGTVLFLPLKSAQRKSSPKQFSVILFDFIAQVHCADTENCVEFLSKEAPDIKIDDGNCLKKLED